jgi:hypothetical protein
MFVTDLTLMDPLHAEFGGRAFFIRNIHCVVASVSVAHM